MLWLLWSESILRLERPRRDRDAEEPLNPPVHQADVERWKQNGGIVQFSNIIIRTCEFSTCSGCLQRKCNRLQKLSCRGIRIRILRRRRLAVSCGGRSERLYLTGMHLRISLRALLAEGAP